MLGCGRSPAGLTLEVEFHTEPAPCRVADPFRRIVCKNSKPGHQESGCTERSACQNSIRMVQTSSVLASLKGGHSRAYYEPPWLDQGHQMRLSAFQTA